MKNGLDDFLVRYGAETLWELVRRAKPTLELHVEENTSTNLIFEELTGLNNDIERKKILKQIAVRERVSVEDVQSEFQKYTIKQKENTENEGSETFTPDELVQAEELLRSPNIMEKMLDLTTRQGYVGEEINKWMLYLSFTSRLMDNSISCVIKGVSASGKSSLAHSVLTLFPKQDVLSYSFITSKALTHFEGDLSHRILLVEERQGAEAADYSIRTSLSEGELSILIPTKNETTGDFKTTEKRIKAKGLVYVETTTRERIHPENQTRLFDLFMDESPEQTDRVLTAEAKAQDSISPELEQESKIWRAAQTLLGQCSVNIPFAERLVEAFPKDKPRVRRDFKRFLALIKSHASLYQFQRERDSSGSIIATLEDLESILPITEVVLIQSHKEISPKLEKVLEAVEKNFGVNEEFSFGELEEKVEFKDRTFPITERQGKRADTLSCHPFPQFPQCLISELRY
ncbi:MAG: hypothetical protein ACM3SR_08005 [Ignavibacteriales bacterium]